MNTCTIEGCQRPHRARGLCQMHYHVARTAGRLPAVGQTQPRAESQRPFVAPVKRRGDPWREVDPKADERAMQARIESDHNAQRAAILGRMR